MALYVFTDLARHTCLNLFRISSQYSTYSRCLSRVEWIVLEMMWPNTFSFFIKQNDKKYRSFTLTCFFKLVTCNERIFL